MKKKAKGKRLNADERPLFPPCNAVHRTKKDKAESRQNRKKDLKNLIKRLDD